MGDLMVGCLTAAAAQAAAADCGLRFSSGTAAKLTAEALAVLASFHWKKLTSGLEADNISGVLLPKLAGKVSSELLIRPSSADRLLSSSNDPRSESVFSGIDTDEAVIELSTSEALVSGGGAEAALTLTVRWIKH